MFRYFHQAEINLLPCPSPRGGDKEDGAECSQKQRPDRAGDNPNGMVYQVRPVEQLPVPLAQGQGTRRHLAGLVYRRCFEIRSISKMFLIFYPL